MSKFKAPFSDSRHINDPDQSAALDACLRQIQFKTDLLDFIDDYAEHLGPTRRLLMIYQDERKHRKTLQRFADYLQSSRPSDLTLFHKHHSQCTFEMPVPLPAGDQALQRN